MTELLAEVPTGRRAVCDMLRGAADAWFQGGGQGQRPARAPALASLAWAAGLGSALLALERALATLETTPTSGSFWWWMPVAVKVLLSGAVLLIGARLAWNEHWRSGVVLVAMGTWISILAWQVTLVPINDWGVSAATLAMGPLHSPWVQLAAYWPLQVLASLVAMFACVAGTVWTDPSLQVPSAGREAS